MKGRDPIAPFKGFRLILKESPENQERKDRERERERERERGGEKESVG
jgi:hypothetical protein